MQKSSQCSPPEICSARPCSVMFSHDDPLQRAPGVRLAICPALYKLEARLQEDSDQVKAILSAGVVGESCKVP